MLSTWMWQIEEVTSLSSECSSFNGQMCFAYGISKESHQQSMSTIALSMIGWTQWPHVELSAMAKVDAYMLEVLYNKMENIRDMTSHLAAMYWRLHWIIEYYICFAPSEGMQVHGDWHWTTSSANINIDTNLICTNHDGQETTMMLSGGYWRY